MNSKRSKTSASDQTDFYKRYRRRRLLFFSLVGDSAISILTIRKVSFCPQLRFDADTDFGGSCASQEDSCHKGIGGCKKAELPLTVFLCRRSWRYRDQGLRLL